MDYTITIYTRKNCPWCTKLMQWMSERSLNFIEKNIRENSDFLQEVKDLDVPGVPYILVEKDGETIESILGFNKSRLGRIYKRGDY